MREQGAGSREQDGLDPWLLSKLCCPLTRTPLRLVGAELISDAARLAYPIREGTPVLLVEEARPL